MVSEAPVDTTATIPSSPTVEVAEGIEVEEGVDTGPAAEIVPQEPSVVVELDKETATPPQPHHPTSTVATSPHGTVVHKFFGPVYHITNNCHNHR
jgi:hypothetical protein